MLEENSVTTRPIRYQFCFDDGTEKEFVVHLDRDTLALVAPERDEYPDWTRLEFKQCPNCPLSPDESPLCPIAKNISELISFFSDRKSYDVADVRVVTEDRVYSRDGLPLQKGVSSLIGVFMVSSGCPVLDRLRPMVDTHLPFASTDETTYRVLSMYMLAQYFRMRNGQKSDWSLEGLLAQLREIQTVNTAFCDRLRAVSVEDASINALVILNTFGDMTTFTVEEDELDRLEEIFRVHLDRDK